MTAMVLVLVLALALAPTTAMQVEAVTASHTGSAAAGHQVQGRIDDMGSTTTATAAGTATAAAVVTPSVVAGVAPWSAWKLRTALPTPGTRPGVGPSRAAVWVLVTELLPAWTCQAVTAAGKCRPVWQRRRLVRTEHLRCQASWHGWTKLQTAKSWSMNGRRRSRSRRWAPLLSSFDPCAWWMVRVLQATKKWTTWWCQMAAEACLTASPPCGSTSTSRCLRRVSCSSRCHCRRQRLTCRS